MIAKLLYVDPTNEPIALQDSLRVLLQLFVAPFLNLLSFEQTF